MYELGLGEKDITNVAAKWLDEHHEAITNRIRNEMTLAIAQSGNDPLAFTGRSIDISFTITLDTICQCLGHVIEANNKAIAATLKNAGVTL